MNRIVLAAVTLGLGFGPVVAQAPPLGLVDQVAQAYADTDQYEATLDFTRIRKIGRWTVTQQAEFHLALDRSEDRLKIDSPGPRLSFVLVIDGQTLRLRSDRFPSHHVEVPAATPLNYQGLLNHTKVEQSQLLAEPLIIDLVMLLADEPLPTVTGLTKTSARPLSADPADADQRPRLAVTTSVGTMTLSIDPATKLITTAVHEIDSRWQGPDNTQKDIYQFRIIRHNQPVADSVFQFQTANSRAVASLDEIVAASAVRAGGSARGHPLINQAAPPIELATADGGQFKLADVDADVIVLDFWTTWCPPCVKGLPQIQNVDDWARQGGRRVGVYAVNVAETVEQVKAFWKDHALTMPVIMDTDRRAAAAYGVEGIPQTVVISGQRVHHVHVGLVPNLEQTLKSQIEALLEPRDEGG